MSEKHYWICLNAPLGDRNGTMLIRETEGRVDGWLNVMDERNRFSGTLSGDGQLTLSGTFRTLISTVCYTAAGMISGRHILLNLKTDAGACYPVSGEEFTPDDKIV